MNEASHISAPDQSPTPAAGQHLPAPTLSPAALALGVAFLVWGLISSLIITGIGALLFAMALGAWVREIRHERNS